MIYRKCALVSCLALMAAGCAMEINDMELDSDDRADVVCDPDEDAKSQDAQLAGDTIGQAWVGPSISDANDEWSDCIYGVVPRQDVDWYALPMKDVPWQRRVPRGLTMLHSGHLSAATTDHKRNTRSPREFDAWSTSTLPSLPR